MAKYFLLVKIFSRGRGSRITRAAAYRAGERIHDDRTSESDNYSKRKDIVHSEIILPSGLADHPDMEWARDRAKLWNAVEKAGTRRNSRLGREVELQTRRAVRVNRVRLVCGNESFLVERSGRNEHGIASGPGLAPRTVALPSSAVALLLAGELDRLGAERSFEDALAEARAA